MAGEIEKMRWELKVAKTLDLKGSPNINSQQGSFLDSKDWLDIVKKIHMHKSLRKRLIVDFDVKAIIEKKTTFMFLMRRMARLFVRKMLGLKILRRLLRFMVIRSFLKLRKNLKNRNWWLY